MKNDFLIEANNMGVSVDLSSLLYDTLMNSFRVNQVAINSNLYANFGMVDDELDELVIEVAHKARLILPSPAQTAKMPPVQTVRDVLLFLNNLSADR